MMGRGMGEEIRVREASASAGRFGAASPGQGEGRSQEGFGFVRSEVAERGLDCGVPGTWRNRFQGCGIGMVYPG